MDKITIQTEGKRYKLTLDSDGMKFYKEGEGEVILNQEEECFKLKFKELEMPNLSFNISENGNYTVSYNATINIPQQNIVVSNNEALLEIPDGVYTINSITFESLSCVKIYTTPIQINCPILPFCNCSGNNNGDFEIVSVNNVAGNFYNVQFDACNVNPFDWKVKNQAGVVVKEGSIVPTSSIITINLIGLVNGNYLLEASSTGCQGTASKTFTINNSIINPPTSESSFNCQKLDEFFINYSPNDYSSIVYRNNSEYWIKNNGNINENSVLSVMSCTKAITAVVMFKLKEEGLVDFNIPIFNYLPNYNNYGDKKFITIKNILGHTSGIVADTIYEQNRSLTVQQAADLIGQNANLLFTPNTQFSYSSAAYQIAAAIAEVVTNKPFKQLCKDYIFTPLNISNYRWTETPNLDNQDSTEANPIAGYGLSTSAKEFSKFVKSLAGFGTQILQSYSRDEMFSDATGGKNTNYGYGCTLQNDIVIFSGATGCYSFINKNTSINGLVWQQVNSGQNSSFGSYVTNNINSCNTVIPPITSDTQVPFRFFTTQHQPNQSNLINTLKDAKKSYPKAIFKAPVIFNWRDTVNILSINGTVAGGINDFTQPLQRLEELLSNNLEFFVIIDYNFTSVIGDNPKMGTATYLPEDKIRRRDGGGEVTSISWSSPRMTNVYAYTIQCLTALKNYLTTNYPSYDLSKVYVECPFTQNLENEYPPAQYGNYDNSYDYNPYQIAHFRQWKANKNASNGGVWNGVNRTPTNDNIPEYIGGIETDRLDWRRFIANMYFEVNKKLSETIKSVDGRFKYELNSGFFSDNVFNWRRSDLALTGEMNSFVDMFKHNPARNYHESISNKLVSGIREDQQSTVEWTRADGMIVEPEFTFEICNKVRKSINDGVRQISLSFYEGALGQPPITTLYNPLNINDNNTVLGALHSDGTLYKNYVRYDNPIVLNRSINTTYLSGGGFVDDNGLKITLSATIAENGTNKVRLKINWDLGNYKYISL